MCQREVGRFLQFGRCGPDAIPKDGAYKSAIYREYAAVILLDWYLHSFCITRHVTFFEQGSSPLRLWFGMHLCGRLAHRRHRFNAATGPRRFGFGIDHGNSCTGYLVSKTPSPRCALKATLV